MFLWSKNDNKDDGFQIDWDLLLEKYLIVRAIWAKRLFRLRNMSRDTLNSKLILPGECRFSMRDAFAINVGGFSVRYFGLFGEARLIRSFQTLNSKNTVFLTGMYSRILSHGGSAEEHSIYLQSLKQN